MPSFASTAELATHLQRTFDTDETNAAQQALDLASGVIQRYTGQQLFAGTSTETFPAPRNFTTLGGVLVLRQRPVTAIISLTVDDVAAEYTFDGPTGIVDVTLSTPIAQTVRRPTVSVDYAHGYATIPDDLKAICLEIAQRAFTNPEGYVQVGIGNYSHSYGSVRNGVGFMLSERHERMLAGLR